MWRSKGAWLTPTPKRKPPAGELLDQGRGLGKIRSAAGVEIADRRTQWDALGRERQGQAETQAVPDAGAVDAVEIALLDLARQVEDRPSALRGRGDRHSGTSYIRHAASFSAASRRLRPANVAERTGARSRP
jgi:hypothetical protein